MLRLSPVFMAILTSNILMILLTFFLFSQKIMVKAGYKLLAAFVGLIAIRSVFLIEVPGSRTIIMPEGLSNILLYIRHPIFVIYGYEVSVWTLITFIWLLGIAVNLWYCIHEIMAIRCELLVHGKNVTMDERYCKVIERICREQGKRNCFQIIELDKLTLPVLYAHFRHPYILVPKGFARSDLEMYYILRHACTYYFHHGMILKYLVRLLTIIYWWNPFNHILNRQTDMLLEMWTDDMITSSGKTEAYQYMKCLVNVLESPPCDAQKAGPVSGLMLQGGRGTLVKRFKMLIGREQKTHLPVRLLLTGLMAAIFVFSYMWTFVPEDDGRNDINFDNVPIDALEVNENEEDIFI